MISEFLNRSARTRKKDHLLLFFEEPEFGRMIEFYFLKLGLERGERSVYIILDQDKSTVEKEMIDSGIDVDKYTSRGLLHIAQVQDPLLHPDGVGAGIQAAFQKALANVQPPFRVTDRLFPTPLNRMESKTAASILDAERHFHQSLQTGRAKNTTYLCSYSLDNIDRLFTDSPKISEGMLKSHNGVIYSTLRSSLALHLD